jgi:hypothetical protein
MCREPVGAPGNTRCQVSMRRSKVRWGLAAAAGIVAAACAEDNGTDGGRGASFPTASVGAGGSGAEGGSIVDLGQMMTFEIHATSDSVFFWTGPGATRELLEAVPRSGGLRRAVYAVESEVGGQPVFHSDHVYMRELVHETQQHHIRRSRLDGTSDVPTTVFVGEEEVVMAVQGPTVFAVDSRSIRSCPIPPGSSPCDAQQIATLMGLPRVGVAAHASGVYVLASPTMSNPQTAMSLLDCEADACIKAELVTAASRPARSDVVFAGGRLHWVSDGPVLASCAPSECDETLSVTDEVDAKDNQALRADRDHVYWIGATVDNRATVYRCRAAECDAPDEVGDVLLGVFDVSDGTLFHVVPTLDSFSIVASPLPE